MTKRITYFPPELEVLELNLENNLLEGSPGSGGSEPIIPGVDD